MKYTIVVHCDSKNGMSRNGQTPFFHKNFFNALTSNFLNRSALIMGHNTWKWFEEKQPGRYNIVVGRNIKPKKKTDEKTEEKDIFPDYTTPILYDALIWACKRCKEVFVIGGAKLIHEASYYQFANVECKKIYIIRNESDWKCDSFFHLPENFVNKYRTQFDPRHTIYEYVQHEEFQYLNLILEIQQTGERRCDRTGVGTVSVFSRTMRFSLLDHFPLLTTKKVFWRAVVEELLWFISGSTDVQVLRDKNIHIWDNNSDRAFLDAHNFTNRKEFDLGPSYGWLWRNFGGEYLPEADRKLVGGVDQLQELIRGIKDDPFGRRHILTAWNPQSNKQLGLPPCHILSQFYVSKNTNGEPGYLSCSLYQRSGDIGLGIPFNIASYSLLTCMVASVCDLHPKEFIHHIGDAHIYIPHIQPLILQTDRRPFPFPTLQLNHNIVDITNFRFEHIKLKDYQSHPNIPMDMAI